MVFPRNSGKRELHPVAGKVTIRDAGHLAGGQINFFEIDEADPSGEGERVSAKGNIGLDGTFRMGTYQDDDGVPKGRFKVLVTPPRPPNPENPPEVWPPFNVRYARYDKTPLEVTVVPGANRFDLELQR